MCFISCFPGNQLRRNTKGSSHGRRRADGEEYSGNNGQQKQQGKSVTPLRGFMVLSGIDPPGFRCAAHRALIPSHPPGAECDDGIPY